MDKKTVLFAVLLFLFVGCGQAFATESLNGQPFVPIDPILPVSQVKRGMKAEIRTVVHGTKVESFRATLLGVLPSKKSPKNLILIRADDPRLREGGGIAQGMSGSPVYVDGKLVGAIGYGWTFGDSNLGLVTAIEDMIKVFNHPDRLPEDGVAPRTPEEPLSLDRVLPSSTVSGDVSADVAVSADKALSDDETESTDIILEREKTPKDDLCLEVESGDSECEDLGLEDFWDEEETELESADLESAASLLTPEILAQIRDTEFTPLAMPLLTDGISERVAKRISDRLGLPLSPLGSGQTTGEVDLTPEVQPGSAIGVSLAWGDVTMGGIGTLTTMDKYGRFIAFGHPMANFGAVALPVHYADIVHIIPSMSDSFKLGSMGKIIGIVTQDRPEAIGGYIGRLAPASSYTLRFNDIDRNLQAMKRFQTPADPFTGPYLGVVGMLGVLEDLWARRGPGTAIITYRFNGGNLDEGWERRNMFFDKNDLVGRLLEEFEMLAEVFALNQFQEIRPFGVDLSVEITQDPRVVYIEKLEIKDKKDFYFPGEKVEINLTLRPWRKRAVVKTIEMKVPKDAAGFCEIVARGGGIAEAEHESLLAGYRAITSLQVLLNELDSEESNNQIVLEIDGPGSMMEALAEGGEDEGFPFPSPEDFKEDRLKSEIRNEHIKDGTMVIFNSNYYVEGLLKAYIKVERPDIDEIMSKIFAKGEGAK